MIVELRPSQGNLPPDEDYFPCPVSPPSKEKFFPIEEDLANDPFIEWHLDYQLAMGDWWISLKTLPNSVLLTYS